MTKLQARLTQCPEIVLHIHLHAGIYYGSVLNETLTMYLNMETAAVGREIRIIINI